MRLITSASTWLLISTLAFSPIIPNVVKSQGKNPQQGTTPGPSVSKTKIEVQENAGDFAAPWVNSLTITSAGTLGFRYSTNEPDAASAIWQVSDKPFSSGPQITKGQAPHVIASGALGNVPQPGHVSQFEIHFALFAPKTPPPSPVSYWVFVVTKNTRGLPVGIASAPVKITYRKSTQESVDLSGIGDYSSGLPGDKATPMQFEGHNICPACESLANQIKSLETQWKYATQNLQETKSNYYAGEVKDLLKQIALKRAQLNTCMISKCGGKPDLNATFSGTAIMTTTNSDVKGPFKEKVSASVIFYKWDRTRFAIGISAIHVGPFDTPAGSNTTTVTGGGPGTLNPGTGAMTAILNLHFHHSLAVAGDSDLTITVSTSSGSPLNSDGHVRLNGSGKFKDGFLGDDNCTLTITGTISPHP
jgi:hypothetical protein